MCSVSCQWHVEFFFFLLACMHVHCRWIVMKRLGCIRVVEELGGRRTECTSSAPLAWRHIVTYVQQRASRLAPRKFLFIGL